MSVKRVFIMSDGTEKTELTDEERRVFAQKITDEFTPLYYEIVMREAAEQEKKAG